MDPTTLTIVSVAAGGIVGEAQRRQLNRLTYRHPDEQHLRSPGPRWWVPAVLALVTGALVWRFMSLDDPWPLLYLLPVAVVAPWLSAIDLDVQRLPYRDTVITTTAAGAGVGIAAWLQRNPTILVAGITGYTVVYLLGWMLWKTTSGRLGFGDVRLAALVGLTTSPLGPWTAWWAFQIAALLSAVWVLTYRSRKLLSYGPWLLAGWLTASLLCR